MVQAMAAGPGRESKQEVRAALRPFLWMQADQEPTVISTPANSQCLQQREPKPLKNYSASREV
ncbi:uncharacterized protein V6R79_022891 [Siganus canaliculatus]